MNEKWTAKVYKRCDKQCHKCHQCEAFEKLIEQIDIEERSALDRQRDAERVIRAREQG